MNHKQLLHIALFLFSVSVPAQSLYNSKSTKEVSYTNSEAFSVSFEKSLYGITFKQNDRYLTDELKTKIERFMKNTNRSEYKGVGTFTLNIIKRNDKYYIEQSNNRLLEL